MNTLEITQPEENLESTESVEQQTLQEIAVEPGARIEETGNFEQAESVEKSLTDAMDAAGNVEAIPQIEIGDDTASKACTPNPKDLPEGSAVLGEPHETAELAEKPEDRGIADVAEVPEGVEFTPAGEDETVDRNDYPMADPSDISEASDDEGKNEATPINVPGPVTANEGGEVGEAPPPEPVPLPED